MEHVLVLSCTHTRKHKNMQKNMYKSRYKNMFLCFHGGMFRFQKWMIIDHL